MSDAGVRPRRQLPEPARFWIVYAPKSWSVAGGAWSDLAAGKLAGLRARGGKTLPAIDAAGLDDLLYLPPVAPELAAERERLAAELIEAGVPIRVQLVPGEETEVPVAQRIYDLLRPLLAGETGALERLPAGAPAVWPLLAGVTDAPELWEAGCRRLAAAGPRVVQPVALALEPLDRRALAEGRDERVYDRLFHGERPSERVFSRHAAGHGLAPFLDRPPTGAGRRRRNRRLAAELALAGELWLRLDRPPAAGQALLRAARGADGTRHDLAALAREDNLHVLPWLDRRGAELVRDVVRRDAATLVAELLADYLGDGDAATPSAAGGGSRGPG